jgi:hypothetical protein
VIPLEPVEGDPTLRRLSFGGRFASRPPDDVIYRMAEDGSLALVEDGGAGEDAEAVPGEGASPAPAGPLDPHCKAILAFLAGTERGGAERAAISKGVELKHKATYVHLDHLAEAKRIVLTGGGVRGNPHVYWLAGRQPSGVPGEETAGVER